MNKKSWLLGAGSLVAVVAAVELLVHLYAGRQYGFFVDELYYLACGQHLAWGYVDHGPLVAVQARLAYFIPEHAADPSIRPADEELWAEVTVPRKGPPRPIQLGVKKNGILTPLKLN